MERVLVAKVFPANGAGLSSSGFFGLGNSCLHLFEWWEGPVVEEALLHQARDFWLERSALPQSAAQADGARVAPHGLHSFFRVLRAHAFERLVNQIHVPSFEVKVLVLLCIGVVLAVLRILSCCCRGGSEDILNIA